MNWLQQVSSTCSPIPIRQLLSQSVYYPAAGLDGDPVRFLAREYQSFIYVDYGVAREKVIESLRDQHHGFHGYDLLELRDVTAAELTPNGWSPTISKADLQRSEQFPTGMIQEPFALWAILNRQADFSDEHGPLRFSVLYIGGDGVATFQALYCGNEIAPAVVALIQPGTGFGGNWTDFTDPQQIFTRNVLENPHGTPDYLLYGGWGARDLYRTSCWPDYSQFVQEFDMGVEGGLCLFSRSSYTASRG